MPPATRLASLALLFLATHASTAQACIDAGPGNQLCNEGGAAWIACTDHGECPAGQICGADGHCLCGEACYEQQCDESGCRCCGTPDPCGTPRYVCERPDAGAVVDAAAVAMDGGSDAESSGGCSMGPRSSAGGAWALAAIVALALRRRRAR